MQDYNNASIQVIENVDFQKTVGYYIGFVCPEQTEKKIDFEQENETWRDNQCQDC